MTDRLKKEDFVRLLATRMNADKATATAWVDGIVETLYESFKDGNGVTLPGFGGFYVRESQVRLLLAPIAQRLLARLGKEGIEQRVRNILIRQRQVHAQQPGYLAGNIINLLSYLHCNLHGLDFSHLVVRQAYLQGVMLPEVNFSNARFVTSIFSNTFGNILAIACSPQGHVLAAGTTAGEIWIYDTLSGVLRLICHGHTDGVWSLAFSPDGSLLASSSDDHTVRLWNSNSGHCLRILKDHTNRVRAIAFSPDGSMLASGSDDQTIRFWDTNTGHHLKTLSGHASRVWSVAFHPASDIIASSSEDQMIRLWDISTGHRVMLLEAHHQGVRSIAFTLDGHMLVSGGEDQAIRVWDVTNGHCLRTTQGYTNRVWSIAFHLVLQ